MTNPLSQKDGRSIMFTATNILKRSLVQIKKDKVCCALAYKTGILAYLTCKPYSRHMVSLINLQNKPNRKLSFSMKCYMK